MRLASSQPLPMAISMVLAIEDNPTDNCAVFAPGSHRLTLAEKERRFGIEAEPQASDNVRYSGQIAPEFFEPMFLHAGQAMLFHPWVLHASSGYLSYLSGQFEPSGHRMNLTLRVAASGARLRDEAFPGERETSDAVLRTICRSAMLE